VNMEGLQQIVDAPGGITSTPSMSFTSGNYSFTEGQPTQMDGDMALSYVRMRYEDPQGDYGRQARQRQVVQGIISSIASIDSIFNYQDVLSVLGNNMQTNM
ncbi:LCP family glycopolymer transferase, partial [Salmonella enterica]|uniref:LCP family glycopolymer transferase n=1 Tax=Salmonella enterica TaxID=28901 RepID=UPI000CAD8D70